MAQTGPRRGARFGIGLVVVSGLLALPTTAAVANPTTPTAPTGVGTDAAIRDAQKAITGNRSAFRATGNDKFVATDAKIDPNGSRHVRFDREYKGLPVLGGDVVVHNGPAGQYAGSSVTQSGQITTGTTPAVQAQQAAQIAAKQFVGKRGTSTPALAVDALDGNPALVWRVVVTGIAPDNGPSRLNVLVDAKTGAVRRSWDAVQTFATRERRSARPAVAQPVAGAGNGKGYQVGNVAIGVNSIGSSNNPRYELKDPARGNGETRDADNKGDAQGNTDPTVANSKSFTSSTTTFGDNTLNNRATVAVDAHYGIQQTWDYYKNVHNRNGIKGDGKGVRSYVHYYVDYDNAGWSPSCFCMIYGDGAPGQKPFTQLDVAGHEMSHGVTTATADLVYENESGGLNEATSDIFGTEVEFYTNNPNDKPDFLIGEKIATNPLRYMDNPTRDGRSKGCWYNGVGGVDVHFSSGIGNHLYFLLAIGSGAHTINGVSYNSPTCGNAPAVTGIGQEKASKIWYRALTTYFTSNETYAKARLDTIKAANDLYPAADCNTLKAAWTAVAVPAGSGEPACTGASTSTDAPAITSPGNQTGKVGTAVSLQLRATDPQGDTITYTATGLPAGLSISSSGRITGTPTAAGTSSVTVSAKDSANHTGTTTFTWTITSASGSCSASQAVGNPSFENGTSSWSQSSGVIADTAGGAPAHSGTHLAWLGGYGKAHTDTLSQSVTVPAGCTSATLSYYVYISTAETGSTAYDTLTVKVGSTTVGTFSNANAASGYVRKTVDLSSLAGRTVALSFTAVEDSSVRTNFIVDDVTIDAS